jgi:ADP-ribosylglycohydrolase
VGVIGACFYVETGIRLLRGRPIRDAVLETQEFISEHFSGTEEIGLYSNLLGGKIISLTEKDIRGSSEMVSFITAVVWTLLQNKGYREAVLRAVNLGEDTDCLGAAVGGLAGIAYGFNGIPDEWVTQIARREDISQLVSRFSAKMKSWEARRIKKESEQQSRLI